VFTTPAFWERFWRTSGIQFVVFFIIAYAIYGYQPPIGASADALVAFYDGNRTRILIAAMISGVNILNLMWFAAAIRTALADTGKMVGARRRPPPAQPSERCSSCKS
jgi:magnesium-transporting ATPase (P-type)